MAILTSENASVHADHSPRFPRVLDNTMLTTFDACPQAFFNEYVLRLAARGSSIHLHAGGAFATLCETVRREIFLNGRSVSEALCAAYEPYVRAWHPFPINEDLHAKNFISMFNAAVEYFNEFPPQDDLVQPYTMQDGKPAIEFTFSMELPFKHPETGDPLIYAGRFDMLGVTPGGMLCVVDEKTTQSLGPTWANKWNMRGQFLGYILGARQFFGERCNSFMVRGIAILKTKYEFASYGPVPVEDWRLEDWWRNTIVKVAHMLRMWNAMQDQMHEVSEQFGLALPDAKHQFWTRSYGDACASYGGCQFVNLCSVHSPSSWYGDYDERLWNPLEKDPTHGSETIGLAAVEPVVVPGLEHAMAAARARS